MEAETPQNKKINFICIREEVLTDRELTPSEKLVYARILGFSEFWESAETTAELLGLSDDKVKKAKQKLEKTGRIKCIKNTGHGKCYRPVFDYYDENANNADLSPFNEKDSKTPVSDAKTAEKGHKMAHTAQLNEDTDEKPTEYGEHDINVAFETWKMATGLEIRQKTRLNRYAVKRLNNAYGAENVLKSIPWVAKAQTEDYAPKISNFLDLWDKWNDLCVWVKRKQGGGKKTRKITTDSGLTYYEEN